jgi:hypothetical protein
LLRRDGAKGARDWRVQFKKSQLKSLNENGNQTTFYLISSRGIALISLRSGELEGAPRKGERFQFRSHTLLLMKQYNQIKETLNESGIIKELWKKTKTEGYEREDGKQGNLSLYTKNLEFIKGFPIYPGTTKLLYL